MRWRDGRADSDVVREQRCRRQHEPGHDAPAGGQHHRRDLIHANLEQPVLWRAFRERRDARVAQEARRGRYAEHCGTGAYAARPRGAGALAQLRCGVRCSAYAARPRGAGALAQLRCGVRCGAESARGRPCT